MAKDKAPAQKPKGPGRGRPWSKLANAMIEIGKEQAEAVQIAWSMWFEYRCPITWEALSDNKEALRELYEQSSGQLVEDTEEDQEEDETPGEEPLKE